MNTTSPADRPRVRADAIAQLFAARHGRQPRQFRAPGRINLIGEHTDYSEGFVMPAAIDRHCHVAAAAADHGMIRLYSANMDEEASLPLDSFDRRGGWTDYVSGVCATLHAAGIAVPGCDLVIESDVPLGAGVSSSAALEVAVTLALVRLAGANVADGDIARWAHAAESTHVGVPCGPMDQFISVHGRAGHALMLDCRTMTTEPVAIPPGVTFLLINSGVKHALVDGGYKSRRDECAAAAERLCVNSLRDATPEALAMAALPETLRRRTRHVVTENARVRAAADALQTGDAAAMGALMTLSHASLRDDFAVTCAETDALARIAAETPGVHGARQMGGGFGGCVIALADTEVAAAAARHIRDGYRTVTGITAKTLTCVLVDGAREVTP